jgi:hypothetical protein
MRLPQFWGITSARRSNSGKQYNLKQLLDYLYQNTQFVLLGTYPKVKGGDDRNNL